MKTILATEARPKLVFWVQRALSGEDIRLVWKGQTVALRRIAENPGTELLQEYNVPAARADKSLRRAERDIRRARRAGKTKPYTGERRSLLED